MERPCKQACDGGGRCWECVGVQRFDEKGWQCGRVDDMDVDKHIAVQECSWGQEEHDCVYDIGHPTWN